MRNRQAHLQKRKGCMAALAATYLLPIRRTRFDRRAAAVLRNYLQTLSIEMREVLVVDGSPADVFAEHQAIFGDVCRHEKVDRKFTYPNGKVNGIHTGVEQAAHEKIILADDDIRYDAASLRALIGLLDQYEVVRPQNFISPVPWWGGIEGARMLINRATLRAADYPGTCAFRRSAMLRAGHYDGDVLFDNEEMIRHFLRSGLTVLYANDLFVRKQAPPFRKWLEQRPRQAYEDFPFRLKTILFAALIPIGLTIDVTLGWRALLVFVTGLSISAIALAFIGYARGTAREVFSWTSCLYAPFWILERAVSTYWAFYWYLRHGGYPFGDALLSKGVGQDWVHGGRIASRQLREQS